jgi:PAS domain S-box-containing protein
MGTYSTTEARILVVDDERPIVRLLTRALESVGYYHVTGMTDSVGVPGYLDSSPPDMIVLDLSMPGLDGFGLLGEINARLPKDTFLPVLVLSGLHDTESKERAFQAGAKDYLTKPVVLSEFLIHVDSLLQTRFTSLRLQEARDVMAHVIGRQADELCKSDTVRKHAEDELRESEFKFRTVADLTHDWEYWMGTDRRLIWMSPSCERVTGYTVDEFMADPGLVDAIVHPEDRGTVREHVSHAVNGDTASLDFRIVTKSGETRWIAHQCVGVHDREGRHLGRRASNRDISDRKMAEERLEESLARIRESQATIIQVLSSVTEFRDPYTAGHQQRVAEICVAIATRMGLAPDRIEGLEVAALLHDVGKVCVPLEILSTPGKFSPLQRLLVEGHVSAGYEILRPIFFSWPVAEIVLQHHERMNGSGYPAQLSGEQIELEARILGVADTFEAMTTHRPYRGALETGVALQEIEAGSGILFDVAVVDALVRLVADGTIAPRMELDLSACSFMS